MTKRRDDDYIIYTQTQNKIYTKKILYLYQSMDREIFSIFSDIVWDTSGKEEK